MKIVCIAHSFPFPLSEGVKLHVYHLLKHLHEKHEIHLISFIQHDSERLLESEIKPFCRSVTLVTHPVTQSPWRRVKNILLQPWPFSVYQYTSNAMAQAIQQTVLRVQPDVVHFDFTTMAAYAADAGDRAKVFFPHDAMSMLFHRTAHHERRLLPKLYWASQAIKMKRYEEQVLPLFERSVVVSPVDRDVLLKRSPKSVVVAAPNGVDADYFRPLSIPVDPCTVLFRGIMSFPPNYDAALFFADDVMPLVWQKHPEALFKVVGAHPPNFLVDRARHEPRLKLVGFVDDLREPMQQATVIVCPMRSGSGIKNKVLESLAMEKAVVATPMSLAGISAEHEANLLIGQSAQELAAQTLRALQDAALRLKLGKAGRALVLKHHSWTSHAEVFSAIYHEAILAHQKGKAS